MDVKFSRPFRNVEDLLAEQGGDTCRETARF
jgi:hypothetical protein